MSYADFVEAVSISSNQGHEDVAFGDAALAKGPVRDIDNVKVKFYIANMSYPDHVEEAERIFTKSLQCQNALLKPGDISVFKEESNFTKTGEYQVVIKYAEFEKPVVAPTPAPGVTLAK